MKTKPYSSIILFFAIVCLSINLAACSDYDDNNGNYNDTSHEEQAKAYFTVFETLFAADQALNSDAIYIVFDLSNTMIADPEPLIALFQGFCEENGYEFMLDTIDGLREKGYIKDFYFEEGFVIVFNDIKLEANLLVTSAQKWRSGLGAIGADYTVEKNGNVWEITKTDNSWIS